MIHITHCTYCMYCIFHCTSCIYALHTAPTAPTHCTYCTSCIYASRTAPIASTASYTHHLWIYAKTLSRQVNKTSGTVASRVISLLCSCSRIPSVSRCWHCVPVRHTPNPPQKKHAYQHCMPVRPAPQSTKLMSVHRCMPAPVPFTPTPAHPPTNAPLANRPPECRYIQLTAPVSTCHRLCLIHCGHV